MSRTPRLHEVSVVRFIGWSSVFFCRPLIPPVIPKSSWLCRFGLPAVNSKKLRFGLKSVFALAAIVAVSIPIAKWLRADTIFYADASFIIRFPDGKTIATNRWFRRTSDLDFSLLVADQARQFNIIQDNDSSAVATINYDGKKYAALITHYRVRGPSYRGEFWLKLGKEFGVATDDAKTPE